MGRRERVGRGVLGYYSTVVVYILHVGSRLWSGDGGGSWILRGVGFCVFLRVASCSEYLDTCRR
jgi:hypothetical protein